MNKTFLQYTAEDILSKYDNLSDIAVVFPNKRASLFFNEYIARLAGHPIWSPSYITISDLFRQHSPFTVGDPIKLVCDLHKSFISQTGLDETLDKFYGWGQLLLADFDDIDKNMADADKVFQNLSDYHNFDNIDYLDEEQIQILHKFFDNFDESHNTRLKDKFMKLWSRLGDIYKDYNQRLAEQNIAYEGALYRKVANDETIEFKYRKYIFIGFNVLQKVETTLFDRLKKEGKASFYWDYDEYYMRNRSEAGHYISQYLKYYPNELTDHAIFDNFRKHKDITYISVPTENIQARYISDWLRTADRLSAGSRTAIVLCDESLLSSVVHCLPPEADKVNITTGYPLSNTPVFSLVSKLINLRTLGFVANGNKYKLHFVNAILKHPYAHYISENTNKLLGELNEHKIYYPSDSQLGIDDNLKLLFSVPEKEETSRDRLKNISTWIISLLRLIAINANDKDPLFQESVFRTYTIFNRIISLIDSGDLDVDIATYERLINQIINSTSVPFHGEPVVGIQIMGVLETRNLDFDHVLILSCNEGNMPKGVDDSSFIPYSIRKSYGLTVVDNKVAIYAYYFHRLLQRAGDVTITYNNSTEDGHKGEMSRFMLQLMVESKHKISYKTLKTGQTSFVHKPESITKTDAVLDILRQRFIGDHLLSPSAINTYMRCPLQFYYNYVTGISEPDDNDEDEIDNRIFGNIFHDSAQHIYMKLSERNGEIRKGDIEAIQKNKFEIERIVDYMFKRDLFNVEDSVTFHPEYNGLQLINREVIIKYLNKLLDIDKELAPFTILAVEGDVSKTETITTSRGSFEIRIGGRIDRLDMITEADKGERIRVIDYKTGAKSPKPLKTVNDIFEPSMITTNHSDYYLQTFMYALIVSESTSYNQDRLPVSPALLFIQHTKASGDDKYDPTLLFGNEKIIDVALYKDDYIRMLQEVINSIFEPTIDFIPTENPDRCQYCPYVNMCGI